MTPPLSPPCLSDLVLDRIAAGELGRARPWKQAPSRPSPEASSSMSPLDEYLLAVFDEKPVTVAQVERAVAALRAQGTLDLGTLQHLDLPGRHHWIHIRKR